jgi:hypothetical protein
MITVETLRRCAWLSSVDIEKLIRKGYPKDVVLAADFVGISNGGQFVYNVAVPFEDGIEKTKVFVWQDNNGEVVADY